MHPVGLSVRVKCPTVIPGTAVTLLAAGEGLVAGVGVCRATMASGTSGTSTSASPASTWIVRDTARLYWPPRRGRVPESSQVGLRRRLSRSHDGCDGHREYAGELEPGLSAAAARRVERMDAHGSHLSLLCLHHRRVDRAFGPLSGQLACTFAGQRCSMLFGLLLALYPSFNFSTVRVVGVLPRLAFCYFAAAVVYRLIFGLSERSRLRVVLGLAAGLLVTYWALLKWVPAPGGVAGDLSASGNLGGWIRSHLHRRSAPLAPIEDLGSGGDSSAPSPRLRPPSRASPPVSGSTARATREQE